MKPVRCDWFGKAGSAFAFGLEGQQGSGSILGLFELVNLQLSLLEASLAGFQQAVALFKLSQELSQRHIARFHGFDDGFKTGEGDLEGRDGLGFGFHKGPTLGTQSGFSTKL